ncbi:MAG: galactose ABC transporter substrate-binding protein, partial [Roseburia sp.]|nr:galactose ABC transporter substrate-binding protein [Roseburia sp.]
GEDGQETLRLGVALYSQDDTFISSITQNLERMVQEAEVDLGRKINISMADGANNQTTQMEQVDRFLDRGYDMLFVNIVDRTAAAVLIDKAEEAGVPVIFFNRQPVAEDIDYREQVYYVGARAEEGGAMQGQLVLDAWQDERLGLDRSGDGVLQYVMLEGEPGHQDSLLRTEWSIKTLTDAGVAVEKLASDAANWNRGQAAARMGQWLDEFGDGIEVVFSNNDDMALGAIDAIREWDGPRLLVVGVDATAPALEAVSSGELYGTVLNDARGIAQAMLDLALALAEGEDPAQAVDLQDGHYVWLPYRKIDGANLEQFLQEQGR